jgi:hypothetical protein
MLASLRTRLPHRRQGAAIHPRPRSDAAELKEELDPGAMAEGAPLVVRGSDSVRSEGDLERSNEHYYFRDG